MQPAALFTGMRVFHSEAPPGSGDPGLISLLPALRTAEGSGTVVSDDPDRTRIERARSGDPEAFGEVFHAYRLDVRRLCRRFLGDDAAAEDAAGEAFLRAKERLASYDESRPFRSWLLAIAANHCTDLLRRRTLEKRLFEERGVDPAEFSDR